MRPIGINVAFAATAIFLVFLGTYGPESLAIVGWLGAVIAIVCWLLFAVSRSRSARASR